MTTTHATPAEATAYEDDAGSGWVDFAALMLAIAGVMRFFDALWAFRYHGQLPDDESWIPMVFFRLDDGSEYVHFGARATPKVS